MLFRHLYHLVDFSPWPFFLSFSLFFLLSSFGMFLHFFSWAGLLVLFSLFLVSFVLFFWWRDVVRESTYLGVHTFLVQRGLRIGFILFIFSEIFFFLGFFWAFFHNSLCPSVWLGYQWPPFGLEVFSAFGVPLFNTLVLLSSGATVTVSHWGILVGDDLVVMLGLGWTLVFGALFILMQFREYLFAPFSISDGIYGSIFYMLTGLHGCHVIVGFFFLLVCFFRFFFCHFVTNHHLGFEFAIWYWHFVDVVWLFLFVFLYCWGNWLVSF